MTSQTERNWTMASIAASQVAFAAMQFLLLWVAAAFMSLGELAALSLAQSIVWPLSMIAQLQLRTVYLVRDDGALFRPFAVVRVAGSLALLAAGAWIALALPSTELLLPCVLALSVLKSAEHLADLVHGELQRNSRVILASMSQTGRCLVFIVVFTAGCYFMRSLIGPLSWAVLALVTWIALVDLRAVPIRQLLRSSRPLNAAGHQAIVSSALALSAAQAFAFFALVSGRWAASRHGDLEGVAAAALAATVASAASLILNTSLQYSLPAATQAIRQYGPQGLDLRLSGTVRRLHLTFAGLLLAWMLSVLVVRGLGPSLPALMGGNMMAMTLGLTGCFVVGGWLASLCFKEVLLLLALGQGVRLLMINALQAAVAILASMLAYPHLGWLSIGLAELLRAITYVFAVRLLSRKLHHAAADTAKWRRNAA